MPILIHDFTWEQSQEQIIIKVKYYEKISRNADIFIHKNYVKVNNPPFYFEKFLKHPIDDSKSRCRLMDFAIYFYLKKLDEIEWDELEMQVDKHEVVEEKEKLLKDLEEVGIQRRKERLQQKTDAKRHEMLKEIERESTVREKIENMSKTAFEKEIVSFEKTKMKPAILSSESPPMSITRASKQKKIEPPPLPRIRSTGNIVINFSKRNFVTPIRESQREVELEWLTKQHLAKKTIGFNEEDLRPEERNPEWLKDKGDEFLAKQNYLGAVAAYSAAIRITDKYYALYLKRSAAHFALSNYQRSTEDCSKALELLTPHCDANLQARIECIARRGKSLFHLGYTSQGEDEIIEAIKLDPMNSELKQELEELLEKYKTN